MNMDEFQNAEARREKIRSAVRKIGRWLGYLLCALIMAAVGAIFWIALFCQPAEVGLW